MIWVNKKMFLILRLNMAPKNGYADNKMRMTVNWGGFSPPENGIGLTKKMQEALKSFKQYLVQNNLRLTQQRLLIFKIFMSDEGRISSEQLLLGAQDVDTTISRSTVYRTVKHLHCAGIARCIHESDGITYYEPMGDQSCQMICERCGRTIPVKNPYYECLQQETARQQGFTLYRYTSVLYGLCSECSANQCPEEQGQRRNTCGRRKP